MSRSTTTPVPRMRNGLTSERHGTARSAGVGTCVELLDVVGAQALDQGVLQARLRQPALVHQPGQADAAGRGQRQAARVAAAAREVGGDVGRRQRGDVRGQLAHDPADAEGQDAGAEAGERADGVGDQGGGHGLAGEEPHGAHVTGG